MALAVASSDVRREAESKDDRTWAALAWGGVIVGGPVLPLVALFTQKGPNSLARLNAKAACILWAVWLPILIGVIVVTFANAPLPAREDYPPPAFFLFMFGGWAVVLLISVVAGVRALRAPISLATFPAPPSSS